MNLTKYKISIAIDNKGDSSVPAVHNMEVEFTELFPPIIEFCNKIFREPLIIKLDGTTHLINKNNIIQVTYKEIK